MVTTEQKTHAQPRARGVACSAWFAAFNRGEWVSVWVIIDPYGEIGEYSFARTRREAWEKFCAPAMTISPRRLSREGFKAVRKRARIRVEHLAS